jgi:hypothetical protein
MSQLNLDAMRAVADRLDSLGLAYAFVGGSIVNLLLDDPAFSPVGVGTRLALAFSSCVAFTQVRT